MSEGPLSGRMVVLFESRYGGEFAGLVHKQGGKTRVAKTIIEAPLELGPELTGFLHALENGEIDIVLVLTGVGHKKLVEVLAPLASREKLAELLGRTLLCARGPKSSFALKESGLKAHVCAPPPHTWVTLLEAVERTTELSGKRVAIQQYGVPHEKLTKALEARGAHVTQVPVYRWQLPEDLGPIGESIDAICKGEVDIVLFTAGPQAFVMLEVAKQNGREDELRTALTRVAIGSIGPSCTEALRNLDVDPDFEPEHGKMGHLVLEAARVSMEVLARKRAG